MQTVILTASLWLLAAHVQVKIPHNVNPATMVQTSLAFLKKRRRAQAQVLATPKVVQDTVATDTAPTVCKSSEKSRVPDFEHNVCPSAGEPQDLNPATIPRADFKTLLNEKYTNQTALIEPILAISTSDIRDNFSVPVPTEGSKIDIQAYILRAIKVQHPKWSAERCMQHLQDIPRGSSEFVALENSAKKLIWDQGRLGLHPWHHIVHARVYDIRGSFYDPRFRAPELPWVKIKAQSSPTFQDSQPTHDAMLGRFITMPTEFVGRTTQHNDVTQDRSATILSMVWQSVHEAETEGYKICPSSKCKVVVRIEGSYEQSHEVNCTTGSDIYPPYKHPESGKVQSLYGGSLTLVTARIIPRDQILREALYPRLQRINYDLVRLATGRNAVATRRSEDMFVYGDTCFLTDIKTTSDFYNPLPMDTSSSTL